MFPSKDIRRGGSEQYKLHWADKPNGCDGGGRNGVDRDLGGRDYLGRRQKKGFVQCGVGLDLLGFSRVDENGKWTGLDVDVRRALAAALFGDVEKVEYTPLTSKERFTALQSGEADILSHNTTWTLSREFPAPHLHPNVCQGVFRRPTHRSSGGRRTKSRRLFRNNTTREIPLSGRPRPAKDPTAGTSPEISRDLFCRCGTMMPGGREAEP